MFEIKSQLVYIAAATTDLGYKSLIHFSIMIIWLFDPYIIYSDYIKNKLTTFDQNLKIIFFILNLNDPYIIYSN